VLVFHSVALTARRSFSGAGAPRGPHEQTASHNTKVRLP
jgi:hypothetical protein